MSLRLTNLRVPADLPEDELPQAACSTLGVPRSELARWRILRKSLDIRDKREMQFVLSLEVTLAGDERRALELAAGNRRGVTVEPYLDEAFELPQPGIQELTHRPLVAGSGPAGLFAAYFLAAGGYLPLILERGQAVRQRIRDVQAFDAGGPLDPESNYLFGEGGAGTFSDGKLTCRNSGPDVRRVLALFAECKGKASVLYDHRPHLGSNRLPAVVKALRRQIESLGGEFRFGCRVEDLAWDDGRVRGVVSSSGYLAADLVVLAVGHSARDTLTMLHQRGVPMEPKPFQIGLRIEQPQSQVNRVQYGSHPWENLLGAADYTLIAKGQQPVFSFCMCAGGQVIPSVSEAGHFCTNGMSLSRRDSPFANSGLMVTLQPEDFGSPAVLAGMHLQRQVESRAFERTQGGYRCPIQRAQDFLAGRATDERPPSSYPRELAPGNLAGLLPPVVEAALRASLPRLDDVWRGEFLREATLVGPESRGSSPVRLIRDPQTMQAPGVVGLYPVGEGAGYAGGIVSAALDGLRAAKAIMATYRPLAESRPS